MLKKLAGDGLKSPIALLLQTPFDSSLRTPSTTETTYTEFKTALRTRGIETATVGVDAISTRAAQDAGSSGSLPTAETAAGNGRGAKTAL